MSRTVWDKAYQRGELLDRSIHPEMESVAALLQKSGVRRVLDLGSGGGRHTIYLASKGFDVYAVDSSPSGLSHTLMILGKKQLSAHLLLHDMIELPYDDAYFDAVIAIQTIHHNRLQGIVVTLEEIRRVLKKQGLAWITMPVSKNEPSTKQEEVEPGTFVPLDGREKGLPHHYFSEGEIRELFRGFLLVDLHVDSTNHFSSIVRRTV